VIKTILFALIFTFTLSHANDQKIKELEAKISLLEKSLHLLKDELDKVKAVQNKPKNPQISKFKQRKFRIGGRIMTDLSFLSADQNVENTLNAITRDRSEFRRARIHIKGASNEKISWIINYDFSESNAKAKNVYIKYMTRRKRGLRVGHTVEPFGFEYMNSSKYITFMERSLLDAFYPKYNTGIFYMDENPKHKFSWSVSLANDAGDDGKTGLAGESSWNSTGRFVYDPFYKNKGKHYLHLGAAFSRRNANGSNIQYATDPESHLWNVDFADTGLIAANSAFLQGYEFLWNKDKLSVQSEYIQSKVDAIGRTSPKFYGWYVYASYFLTDDHRPYHRAYRQSGRVKPKSDYVKGGRGAWQLAARYSYLDLNDAAAGIAGGELSSKTLGLNWFLTSNTRIMWNYVWSDLKGVGDSKTLNMRFQIDF
jgi:phosphate-selective porin OprO/OprP